LEFKYLKNGRLKLILRKIFIKKKELSIKILKKKNNGPIVNINQNRSFRRKIRFNLEDKNKLENKFQKLRI
jgi:hypothetical protein